MNKKIIATIITVVFAIILSITAFAHSGRTDANGGHWDRKTGTYHYHNSGYNKNNYTTTRRRYATRIYVHNCPRVVYVGGCTKLKATVYPTDAIDDEVYWESSDITVVTVDNDGNLEAVGAGTATIKARTSGGTTWQYTVTVKEVFAESITIKKKPKSIKIDEKIELNVLFKPENTTNKDVKWKSSDKKIAKISKDGELIGIGLGKATITVTHKNLKDSFEIEVKPVKAKSVDIIVPRDFNQIESKKEMNTYEVRIDSELSLDVVFDPENTTDKTIKWLSSNEDIAVISENGELKCLDVGETEITVKHKKLKKTILLSVLPIEVETIEISVPDDIKTAYDENGTEYYRIKKNKEVSFSSEIYPDNATYKTVKWYADSNKVEMNNDGVLKALKKGRFKVFVEATNGVNDQINIEVYTNTSKYMFAVILIILILLIVKFKEMILEVLRNFKKNIKIESNLRKNGYSIDE